MLQGKRSGRTSETSRSRVMTHTGQTKLLSSRIVNKVVEHVAPEQAMRDCSSDDACVLYLT